MASNKNYGEHFSAIAASSNPPLNRSAQQRDLPVYQAIEKLIFPGKRHPYLNVRCSKFSMAVVDDLLISTPGAETVRSH